MISNLKKLEKVPVAKKVRLVTICGNIQKLWRGKYRRMIKIKISVSDPYSLNPDQDPDPSYFLPVSELFFKF